MMKFFRTLCICAGLAGCVDKSVDHPVEPNQKQSNTVTPRDHSIDLSNAYSDFFLDSSSLEKFILQPGYSGKGKKMSDSVANEMRSFYNVRNYQFAWFNSDGFTEQARNFWNLLDYVTTYQKDTASRDRPLHRRMDMLTTDDSLVVDQHDQKIVRTEFALTEQYVMYMQRYYPNGIVSKEVVDQFVPTRRTSVTAYADSLINKRHDKEQYFESKNLSYKAMKEQLAKYYAIAKNGGWGRIAYPKKSLKKGVKNNNVSAIKKRLAITGDLAGADSTPLFNESLVNAVKLFQSRHGYTSTGIITNSLVSEMNVPVQERIKQILINLDRVRWMISETKGNLIVVNIPEFKLHVYENNTTAFDMDVVVGKEGHNTTVFNGDLNQVVFSPYWNVPQDIVENEILPAMEKNRHYLDEQEMEITGKDDDDVPIIRQKPGDKNSLGKVKFLFPNSFNIYFHDTPVKSLFNKQKRAYSHGCIRLKEPEKMAEYVLKDQEEWTPDKIEEAMNSGNEQTVKIKHPIPVLITYYTAWVDSAGHLNFRSDIYGHDKTLAGKMFQ